MRELYGIGVQDGLAYAKLHFLKNYKVNEKTKSEALSSENELKKFEMALERAVEEQNNLYNKALKNTDQETANIFKIHTLMLEDDFYAGEIRRLIKDQSMTAENAIKEVSQKQIQMFEDMEDDYLKERSADVKDITRELQIALNEEDSNVWDLLEPSIVIAEDITPSQALRLDKDKIKGFVTKEGSTNSHTAILARTMGIPAIVQCQDLSSELDGKIAILDGNSGKLIVEPTSGLLNEYKEKIEDEKKQKRDLIDLVGKKNITLDNKEIKVYANISSLDEMELADTNDAGGIGLFRSEFIYLDSDDYPSEDEQFKIYSKVLKHFYPKEVVIRTCDIGADKTVDYMGLEKEENPAMGLRAIRLSLSRPEFFKTQLRALLRSSVHGKLNVMFPLITHVEEVRKCKKILAECKSELIEENKNFKDFPIGIMIETPAAALCAEELASEVEFFSIGTNDLMQYTCALDRQNANLTPFTDPHHPAILRQIQMTVKAGHKYNCWVGICGELGADLRLTETFLNMGVDELSVSPGKILPLRQKIRNSYANKRDT